jgi:hypothetical protein
MLSKSNFIFLVNPASLKNFFTHSSSDNLNHFNLFSAIYFLIWYRWQWNLIIALRSSKHRNLIYLLQNIINCEFFSILFRECPRGSFSHSSKENWNFSKSSRLFTGLLKSLTRRVQKKLKKIVGSSDNIDWLSLKSWENLLMYLSNSCERELDDMKTF